MKVRAWGVQIDEWPGASISWDRGGVTYTIGCNPGAGSWPPERRIQSYSHLVMQTHWIGPLLFHRQKTAPSGRNGPDA